MLCNNSQSGMQNSKEHDLKMCAIYCIALFQLYISVYVHFYVVLKTEKDEILYLGIVLLLFVAFFCYFPPSVFIPFSLPFTLPILSLFLREPICHFVCSSISPLTNISTEQVRSPIKSTLCPSSSAHL
jgi:hypothetical protein